ncbi:MAG: quinone-dependent dihydroorotate dehydrogenase [Alicyclobacillus sp.]|nr:quinone-dependent dihydroorotate dehydrogenase [Alicyclobacillus sp.]
MYTWIRPLLFQLDPETAHHLTLASLSVVPGAARWLARPVQPSPRLRQRLWHLDFPHPLGLAAGLDKDGVAIPAWAGCGFAFAEVGTVTPRPQPGNPRPRLFRLPADGALINRMGFNNRGGAALRQRLLKLPARPCWIGVNLGKNKDTPNAQAADDYAQLVRTLADVADYLVINVSSPNTPGLRDLQAQSELLPLVRRVLAERSAVAGPSARPQPPVLVKLAPDLADDDLTELAASLLQAGVDGFIATNTTLARPRLQSAHAGEAGGLSGRPLRARATAVVRQLYQVTRGRVPIIGCGGVFSAADAYEKICAGANLVQIYTALIYRGPQVVSEIVRGLDDLLARDGWPSLQSAVGSQAQA